MIQTVSRDPKYDVLFEPVRIGPKVMRNRFYQTPHCSGFGSDYAGTQAEFRGMKAEGGWAVVNTEYCSIHPESDDTPSVQARIWDSNDVQNLSLMCERAHDHGSLAGIELHFGGPNHTGYESRLPARGVSQIPSARFPMRSCYEMDRRDIRALQDHYVEAAERAREAGFDLVLVYMAEAIPITHQFLMPYFNRRTDEYGGSFENRARFAREVLERVREAVGDECAVGCRFSVDTLSQDGLGVEVGEDGIAFVEHVDHLVDLWDVQVGPPSLLDTTDSAASSRVRPQNYQKPWIEQIRPHTSKPIVGVGRFTDPDVMVEAIRSRQLDIIGAARPSIADPFLPSKIEQGRLDEIRECIGCNICLSRFKIGGMRLVCTQNPTAGEEYRRGWHPERFTRATNADNDVLVVGAGPAGMECAIVLAKRGMRRVHLVDGADELGGIMRWVPQLPGLGEWARVVNYRRIQIEKLQEPRLHPARAARRRRRRRVRRRVGGDRDRRQLVDGRVQRLDSRRRARRGREPAPLPDARAGDARGQAGPRRPCPDLRLRGLLPWLGAGRAVRRRGQAGHAGDAEPERGAVSRLHGRAATREPRTSRARRRSGLRPRADRDRTGRGHRPRVLDSGPARDLGRRRRRADHPAQLQ